MSSVRSTRSTRRKIGAPIGRLRALATAATLALTLPLLAACGTEGFRPMYASTAGSGLAAQLAKLQLSPIPGRVGQRIRNELVFASKVAGDPPRRTHRLEVAIRESVTSTLIRKDGEALSQIYNLEASFKIVDLATNRVEFQGQSQTRAAFDRSLTIFSNVRAREDAENRAAKTMALELEGRIAAFLSRKA